MRNSINLTAAERAACAAAFSTFDKDMSGTIDSAELKQVKLQLCTVPTALKFP